MLPRKRSQAGRRSTIRLRTLVLIITIFTLTLLGSEAGRAGNYRVVNKAGLYKSPSGNIRCAVSVPLRGGFTISCTMLSTRQGAIYHVWILGQEGRVRESNRGFKSLSPARTVPYGSTFAWGHGVWLWIVSRRTGFRVHNSDGHGFFLNRDVQRVF